MMNPSITLLFTLLLIGCSPSSHNLQSGEGLNISQPHKLNLVYTIEPEEINFPSIQNIVEDTISETGLTMGPRDDGTLFLRVEKHAGQYLLYLDFSRNMHYCVEDDCFSKEAFVWGRYAKDITSVSQLEEDVRFFFEDFLESYVKANQMD